MKKVSVIVPVYNVEKYLKKCLTSLVFQTLKDIEIIIVNDGTKDNSAKIIDEFKAQFPDMITVVEKENGGLSSARNSGLMKAGGEYIAFVDSDDWVSFDFLEKLYTKATSNNFDVVVCDVAYIYPDQKKNFVVKSGIQKDLYSREEVKKQYIKFYPAAWNKLYKKELLDKSKVTFKPGVWFEDVEFFHRLLPFINSAGVICDPLYNYLQREGSVTNSHDTRIFDYVPNFEGIIQFYKDNSFFDEYYHELEFSTVRYLFATFIKRCAKLDDKTFDTALKEAHALVDANFPNRKKNPYFRKSGLKGYYLLFFDKIPEKLLKRCL